MHQLQGIDRRGEPGVEGAVDRHFLDLLRSQSQVQSAVDVGLKLRKALEGRKDGQRRQHPVADVQAGSGPHRAKDGLAGKVPQAGDAGRRPGTFPHRKRAVLQSLPYLVALAPEFLTPGFFTISHCLSPVCVSRPSVDTCIRPPPLGQAAVTPAERCRCRPPHLYSPQQQHRNTARRKRARLPEVRPWPLRK